MPVPRPVAARGAPARAGVVLAGGRGTRMGRDKGSIRWRGATLLARVATALAVVVDEVVIVARRGQSFELPPLAPPLRLAFDEVDDLGPLAGIAAGLAACRAPVAFVAACDAPLLVPGVVRAVLEALGEADVALPDLGGRLYPLTAAYRTAAVLPAARALLAAGRLRPVHLLETLPHVRVGEGLLRAVDPDLRSLENWNVPGDVRDGP